MKTQAAPMHGPVGTSRWRRAPEWLGSAAVRYRELLFVAALTAIAIFMRTYLLLDYPPGLHGDEGIAAFDARRVLNEGWVGPYLRSSLGYPSGPAYATAAVFKVFGDSDFSVRLAPALLGSATVPLGYAAFRVMYGYRVAVLAAIFLTFSAWHLHYSRVAFLPIAWPLMEVATMLPLFFAAKTKRWYYFAIAGVMAGFGVYSYGAYPIFVAALALFFLWFGIREYVLRKLHIFAWHVSIFIGGFYIAAFSMIQYASNSSNDYFGRAKGLSLQETPQWKAAHNPLDKFDVAFAAWKHWLESMVWRGHFDGVDAAGAGPMFDKLTVALAAAGLVIAIMNWRRLSNAFVLILVLIIPLAAVFTVDAAYRRTLGLVPALVVLMALPLAGIWRWADQQTRWKRMASYAAVVCIVVLSASINVRYYFGTLASSNGARWTYAEELAQASRYVEHTHPDLVYFYSGRWSYSYDTRKFLAPDVPGEDRSKEFGTSGVQLEADRTKDVLYVFIGGYSSLLPDVQKMYPEGEAHNGLASDGRLLFVAYRVPKYDDGSSSATGTSTNAPVTSPPTGSNLATRLAAAERMARRRARQ